MCRGFRLLKEQEIKSKCQRRNTTEHQQSIFNQQCRGRAEIPEVSCIDGGVARQQQLDDFNVTLRGGDVQRGLLAEGTVHTACICNQIILHDIDLALLYRGMNAIFAFKAGGCGSLNTSNASTRTKTAFGSAVEASSLYLDNC
jgi:hypothetical protein